MAAVATGTTSAHAENTTDHGLPRRGERNYLRARGEYRPVGQHERSASELPPRTRRIHKNKITLTTLLGTTSAHAENTPHYFSINLSSRNYLRARGEYIAECDLTLAELELPPRTRRIRFHGFQRFACVGTTSAHAENTSRAAHPWRTQRNYLRARGEYRLSCL